MNANAPRPSLDEWYQSLDTAPRVMFLVTAGHELTIAAREFYEPQTDRLTDAVAVRELNEIQHRVLAHAASLLAGDTDLTAEAAFGCLESVDARVAGVVKTAVRFAARRTEQMALERQS